MSARERVEALVEAAHQAFVLARTPALVAALAEESGLSREGVALALDLALEHDAGARAIAKLVGRAPARTGVSIVLAANVFTAPLRAIAWALAHAPHVLVRTSRRANVFTGTLLATAPSLAANIEHAPPTDDPEADLEALVAATPEGGALHVYGGEATIEHAHRAAEGRDDLALELHGPGFGAIVAPWEELVERGDDVALDVGLFDQRGCLSPRVAIAIGPAPEGARARLLDALDGALLRFGVKVPRGALDAPTRAELRRAIDAATFSAEARVGADHAVLEYGAGAALPIPPPARALAVVHVADVDAALTLLAGHARTLASLGAPPALHAALSRAFEFARLADLGAMQRPPLDGPVDRRVVR